MYVLERNPLWNKEKPYQLKFDPPEDFPQSNVRLVKWDGATVRDIRDSTHEFSFTRNGFGLMSLELPFDPEREDQEGWLLSTFIPNLGEQVKEFLNASRVQIFNYAVSIPQKFAFGA